MEYVVGMITNLTGARLVVEVAGGHQSRVFAAHGGDLARPLAVKVHEIPFVDPEELETRAAVVEQLASIAPVVCAPVRIHGRLVSWVPGVHVTASEWAVGRPLDPASPDDSALMGRTLAALHASMREVDASTLPPVAALRAVPVAPSLDDQLLHGDVNHGNLRIGAGGVRVFDLDDCGRGPALFDVANAVHMARFSAAIDGTGGETFEAPFVAGYAEGTGAPVDHDLLEHLVEVRLAALRTWLADLPTAPIGIRRADPAWHDVLRRYAG